MPYFESKLLKSIPNLLHGFGIRAEPLPGPFAEYANRLPEWRQVHGIATGEVSAAGQNCGEVDALFTTQMGQPIAVVTADCVPVLLARKDGRAVAAIHAGWRGTKGRILRHLWAQLRERGVDRTQPGSAADWVAAIGPAIGPCCYEVSDELAAGFATEFPELPRALILPRSRYLDLPAINAAELHAIGIEQVEILRHCTRCSGSPENPTFCSYRREKPPGRQYSAIMSLP